jgi:hypothetical protein
MQNLFPSLGTPEFPNSKYWDDAENQLFSQLISTARQPR